VISGSTRASRSQADEAEAWKIQIVDEESDHADKMIFTDPILQPIREKQRLKPVDAFDETRHLDPPLTCRSLP
jgi:hypothetical protein